MSVPNQTPYNIYTANGLTTVFAYEFYLISASDIQVTINGNEVTSGYTVSGVGNTGGGEITFLTAPANGATVIFERVTPTYRLTDYQDNGDLLADTVNKDFDRLWMAIQRAFFDLGFALTRPFLGGPFDAKGYRISNLNDPVNDQDAATKKYVVENVNANFSRTLRVPEGSINILPDAASRKGKVHTYDSATGQPLLIPAGQLSVGDILNLSSSDGQKYVGRCSNIASLRFIEPQDDRQLIDVVCHTSLDTSNPYQINSGGKFQADYSDSTTLDDNWLCIVTHGGKRWKRIIGDTLLNLAWSGVKPGDDITTPLKNAIAYIKKIFIASSGPAFTPVIAINAGNYIISSTIAKPPFIKLVCMGSVDIDASSITSGVLFDVFNDSTIPKPSFSGPGTNCDDISCIGGTLTVTGSGRTEGGVTAFAYGNKSAGLAPCRGVGFRNVVAKFFGAGLSIRSNDTYLLTFSDSRLEQNYTNFITSSVTSVKEGANKQVISSQAHSLIKISRIWADFFPANTSNQPI